MLLMFLSAGTGMWLSFFSRSSSFATAGVGSWQTSEQTQHVPPRLALSPLQERIASSANLGLLASYGLNLGLISLVYVLLRRHGRYRQTLFAKACASG